MLIYPFPLFLVFCFHDYHYYCYFLLSFVFRVQCFFSLSFPSRSFFLQYFASCLFPRSFVQCFPSGQRRDLSSRSGCVAFLVCALFLHLRVRFFFVLLPRFFLPPFLPFKSLVVFELYLLSISFSIFAPGFDSSYDLVFTMYFCSTLFFAMFSQPQHYLERLGLPANIFSSVVILTLVRAVCWCIDCHYLFFFVAFILHFLPSSFVKLFLVMSFGCCFIFTTNSSR